MNENAQKTSPDKGANVANALDTSDIIDKVSLSVEAFLGSTSIKVSEIKNLEEDSVIELSASLNQAVELRVNGMTIGYGELVSVNDKFGVKIAALAK
jgi:flagellar motor switch protein FliN